MRALLRLFLVFIVVSGFASSALGAGDLRAGTYKMVWSDDFSPLFISFSLNPIPPDMVESFKGLKSKNAIYSNQTGLNLILDESKGTGKGYDTLYLVSYVKMPLDLKDSVKIKVGPNPYHKSYLTMLNDPVKFDVRFGDTENKLIKKMVVDQVDINCDNKPSWATIIFTGGWKYCEQLSSKSLNINTNVCFIDDYSTSGNPVFCAKPDGVMVHPGYNDSVSFPLGRPTAYGGKFFTAECSKTGDAVTFKPYSGSFGKLTVKAKNGYGKQAICADYDIKGEFEYSESDLTKTILLPVGNYRFGYDIAPVDGSRTTMIKFSNKDAFEVSEGKETTINIGGPVKAVPVTEDGEIQIVEGRKKVADLELKAGSAVFDLVYNQEYSVVGKIIDSTGKVVWSGELILDPVRCSRALSLPGNLKPGEYTLKTVASIPNYQEPQSCVTKLIISPRTETTKGIQPGKYKLKWKDLMTCSTGPDKSSIALKLVSAEGSPKFKGLVSDRAYWGTKGRVTVVIDSTKPDSHGYDTGYVFLDAPADGFFDVATALKLNLEEAQGWLSNSWSYDDYASSETVIKLGNSESQVSENIPIRLNFPAYLYDKGFCKLEYANILFFSGWVGEIPTDDGYLVVQTVDKDLNGRFDDSFKNWQSGDGVVIANPSASTAEAYCMGKSIYYNGQYYVIRANSVGDEIEVSRYDGPLYPLKINMVDGNGKSVPDFGFGLMSEDAVYTMSSKDSCQVPPAEYQIMAQVGRFEEGYDYPFGVCIGSNLIKIGSDGASEVSVALGGKISAEIEPGSETISVKQGESKEIHIRLSMDGQSARTLTPVVMKIMDAGGKEILKKNAAFGALKPGIDCEAIFKLAAPSDWVPGTYTIRAEVNPGCYQPKFSIEKKLEVVAN